ncbi:LysR substrate-binding domain-containing protein [Photobacterium damselae]|nr:LysR substrate-binding domain-containing protein [Photobacterium damselae]
MPSFVIRDELNSGQLIRILPQAHDLQIPFYIVYQEKSLMPLRVRTLIEFLKQKGDCYQL